jgi:hypothetical protein
MSEQYPGGFISKTPPTPQGNQSTSSAYGIWTLSQAAAYQKQGLWPDPTNSPLYAFTTFTFTTAGIYGRTGPSLFQLQSAYSATSWTQNTAYFSSELSGVQTWTVPQTGNYQFIVAGSSSQTQTAGGLAGQTSGAGQVITATIALTKGQKLNLIVGQMGRLATGNYESGGGGASVVMASGIAFASLTTSNLYIISGGGGGCSQQYNTNSTMNGTYSFTQNNNSSASSIGGGGPAGATYYSQSYSGSGAGGFTSNGGGYTNNDGFINGGSSLQNGFLGGYPPNTPDGDGGFGGGGAARGSSYAGGGGGGGYTGGCGGASSSSSYASGGGSYVNPSLVSTYANSGLGSTNTGGYITVTKL